MLFQNQCLTDYQVKHLISLIQKNLR